MQLILANCEISRVSSRKDGSIGFSVETAELPLNAKAAMLGLHGKAASITIASTEQSADAPIEVRTERDTKTPSQRLRGCIFIWWQQTGQKGDFEQFYREKLEALINHVKTQLD